LVAKDSSIFSSISDELTITAGGADSVSCARNSGAKKRPKRIEERSAQQ
jgi:hypothetical protein